MRKNVLIALLIIVPVMHAYGQYEDLVTINPYSCDFLATHEITLLPPLQMDMPFDVAIGYVVADTMCRLYDAGQIDSILQTISADSILIGVKTFIAMRNYDTFLYEHLCKQLYFHKPSNYRTYYRALERALFSEYYSRVHAPTLYDTLRDRYCGGIYQVRVGSQSMYIDSVRQKPIGSRVAEIYCADLDVIASIYCYNTRFTCGIKTPEDISPCIRVSWFRSPVEYYPGYDSLTIHKKGPGYLEVGKEYLVFMETWNSSDYNWQYHPVMAYEVVNGLIYDPDGVFRRGEYIDVYELISDLHSAINIIAK